MSADKIPARDNSDLEMMANPLQSYEGSGIGSGVRPSLGVGNRRSVLGREVASPLPADTGVSKITATRRASALGRDQAVAKADALPSSAEVDIYNRLMSWVFFGNGAYSIVPIVWSIALLILVCIEVILALIDYFAGTSVLGGTQIWIACCVSLSRIFLGLANSKFGYQLFRQKEFNWELLGHEEDTQDQTTINRCLKVAAVMPTIVIIIYYILYYTTGEYEGKEESTPLSVLVYTIKEVITDSVHVTYLYLSYLWVVLMYSNYLRYTREVEPLALAGKLDDLDEAIYMMTRRMERQNEYWKWNHIIRIISVIIYVVTFFEFIYSGIYFAEPAYEFALMMSYGTCWGMVAVTGVSNDFIREGLLRSLMSLNVDNDRDRARVAQIVSKTSASFRGSMVGGAFVTFRTAITFGSVFIAGISAMIKLSNIPSL